MALETAETSPAPWNGPSALVVVARQAFELVDRSTLHAKVNLGQDFLLFRRVSGGSWGLSGQRIEGLRIRESSRARLLASRAAWSV